MAAPLFFVVSCDGDKHTEDEFLNLTRWLEGSDSCSLTRKSGKTRAKQNAGVGFTANWFVLIDFLRKVRLA